MAEKAEGGLRCLTAELIRRGGGMSNQIQDGAINAGRQRKETSFCGGAFSGQSRKVVDMIPLRCP